MAEDSRESTGECHRGIGGEAADAAKVPNTPCDRPPRLDGQNLARLVSGLWSGLAFRPDRLGAFPDP
jgi:hypothetical protein